MDNRSRGWTVGIVTFALLVGSLVWFLHARANYEFCESGDPHVLRGPQGDTIEMDTRLCGSWTGDPGTQAVFYRHAGTDQRTLIFAFAARSISPGRPTPEWYPQVTWINADHVLIAIGAVSQIYLQHAEAEGTEFTYRIGSVDYP